MKLHLDIGYKKNVLYTNVELDLPKNGIVSFVGDNGSGKSTIYKTLLGMIEPVHGNVPKELSLYGAVVSDYVHLPEEVKVNDIMSLLGQNRNNYVKVNYIDLYDYVNILKKQKIKTLSSGQKRVVEIYTVLSMEKKYIFLDEATNALDFKNKQLFLNHVKQISKKDVLFFHTTHDLTDVSYLGGKIYGLFKNKKKIVEYLKDEPSLNDLQSFLEYEEVRLWKIC